MTAGAALAVDAAGAVAWAAEHPGWFIFPGEVISDGVGGFVKRPRPGLSWTSAATCDPDEIRALWGGGVWVVCVACAPSGIWVLDQDDDLPAGADGDTWAAILDDVVASAATLVLRSSTKGRPHYVFRQGGDFVAEGRWLAGDVKATGMVVVSAHAPLVSAPVGFAPAALLDRLKVGRPMGSGGRGVVSDEDLIRWLAVTPDPDDLLLGEGASDKFIDVVCDRLVAAVSSGEHRRQACRAAVYVGALEAAAGLYRAEDAYDRIGEAYRGLREGDAGFKGWTSARSRDYRMMWASLVGAFEAGDFDAKVDEVRADALERFGGSDEDVSDLMAMILGGGGDGPDPEPAVEVEGGAVVVDEPPPDDEGEGLDWGSVPPESLPESKGPGPVLDEAALWGPHGELVVALRGQHESADVGVLGALIAYAGAFLAGRAHFRVTTDIHGPNEFVVNVGASSAARKSSALSLVAKGVFFDPERMASAGLGVGYMPRRENGIASGERLIHLWAPGVPVKGGDGSAPPEPPERRVLMVESEASTTWKRARRDGAILSDILCKIWDQDELANSAITSGSVRVGGDAHLMSYLGASTTHIAQSTFSSRDGSDAHSGFGNRFLWLYLPDSGVDLPFGGSLAAGGEVAEAVTAYVGGLDLYRPDAGAGGGFGVVAGWSPAARDLWEAEYGRIKRDKGSGLVEAMCSRAESHVLRLALNYWMASGGDPREVGVGALRAALALWAYARASVDFIFGSATGDRALDDFVAELESRGGWALVAELRADLNRNTLAGLIRRGLEAGVLVEGSGMSPKGGGPRRKVVGVRGPVEARLAGAGGSGVAAPMSSGPRPTPFAAVTWAV